MCLAKTKKRNEYSKSLIIMHQTHFKSGMAQSSTDLSLILPWLLLNTLPPFTFYTHVFLLFNFISKIPLSYSIPLILLVTHACTLPPLTAGFHTLYNSNYFHFYMCCFSSLLIQEPKRKPPIHLLLNFGLDDCQSAWGKA